MSKKANKKQWLVSVPFTGYVTVLLPVEPSSHADAFERATEAIDAAGWDFSEDSDTIEFGQVEYHERVTEGNVSHAVQGEIEWEEV